MTDDSSTQNIYRWYAIQCKGRESIRAAENLYRQGFEIFHPLVEHTSTSKEPLFPYYLFIRLNRLDSNWRPIRSTRGVLKIVKFGMEPAAVPDTLIDTLKEYAIQHDFDPINHYIRLKPSLTHVPSSQQKQYLALLDKKNGDERVIALMSLVSEIKDPATL